jgi:hypothetical protein
MENKEFGPVADPNVFFNPKGVNSQARMGMRISLAKLIFFGLGIVVVIELLWAGYSLLNAKHSSPLTNFTGAQNAAYASPTPLPAARITLAGPATVQKGEVFTVDAKVSSSEPIDGTDLIITYDPKQLSLQPVTINKKQLAAAPGTLFDDFVNNSFDPVKGTITVSGVLTPGKTAAAMQGTVGRFSFKALNTGSTTISITFIQGGTDDSNVTGSLSHQDILHEIHNLNVTVQ